MGSCWANYLAGLSSKLYRKTHENWFIELNQAPQTQAHFGRLKLIELRLQLILLLSYEYVRVIEICELQTFTIWYMRMMPFWESASKRTGQIGHKNKSINFKKTNFYFRKFQIGTWDYRLNVSSSLARSYHQTSSVSVASIASIGIAFTGRRIQILPIDSRWTRWIQTLCPPSGCPRTCDPTLSGHYECWAPVQVGWSNSRDPSVCVCVAKLGANCSMKFEYTSASSAPVTKSPTVQ